MPKIYTKTGDNGTTDLGNGKRVPKDDLQIEVYGNIDELNSAIGIVLATKQIPEKIKIILIRVQHELFDLLHDIQNNNSSITSKNVLSLEKEIEEINSTLPPLNEFIFPTNNTLASAFCHLARTICRRTERSITTLSKKEKLNENVLKYINRLSDLLFVIARMIS